MPVDQDFDPQTAAQMRSELERFAGKCRYDETARKIVYHTHQDAMNTYLTLQREEMTRHRWIESQKSDCDVGEHALAEWVHKYSKEFASYWRKTHRYIPAPPPPPTT